MYRDTDPEFCWHDLIILGLTVNKLVKLNWDIKKVFQGHLTKRCLRKTTHLLIHLLKKKLTGSHEEWLVDLETTYIKQIVQEYQSLDKLISWSDNQWVSRSLVNQSISQSIIQSSNQASKQASWHSSNQASKDIFTCHYPMQNFCIRQFSFKLSNKEILSVTKM